MMLTRKDPSAVVCVSNLLNSSVQLLGGIAGNSVGTFVGAPDTFAPILVQLKSTRHTSRTR